MMTQLLRRRAMQDPRSIRPAADPVLSGERADRTGDCRTMRANKVRQPLMRQRQRHGDALRQDASPALGQMPEREQQPIIDPLMVGDRQRDRERVSPARSAVEELEPELWPRRHPDHQVMVQHGQPGWFQDDPANLRPDVRALFIPAPRSDHVASAKQLHATTAQHLDLSTDQPVDDQKAPMMGVNLLGPRDVPIADRQMPHSSPRLAPGAVTIDRRHQILKLGISVDNADRIRGTAHIVSPPSKQAGWSRWFAEELTPARAYPSRLPRTEAMYLRMPKHLWSETTRRLTMGAQMLKQPCDEATTALFMLDSHHLAMLDRFVARARRHARRNGRQFTGVALRMDPFRRVSVDAADLVPLVLQLGDKPSPVGVHRWQAASCGGASRPRTLDADPRARALWGRGQ
jgi:hypothetical protein